MAIWADQPRPHHHRAATAPTPATASAPAPTAEQQGALATLHSFLDPYGLGALAQSMWTSILNGASMAQIMLDVRSSDTYKQAFPGLQAAISNGDISAGDGQEGAYRSLVGGYQQVNQAYGLPKGFYDTPEAIAGFITNRVSPAEYKDRVAAYTGAVLGDQQTLKQLSTLYGTTGHTGSPTGDLLAHYLDPTAALPLLTSQLNAAQFAAAGQESGFGQVSRQEAEQYGAQAGTSPGQAQQGFGALVAAQGLMKGLPGEGQSDISEQTQLGAAFGGDAQAQQTIENRRRLRVVEGEGGGGFSATQRGLAGAGSNEV